MDKWTDGRELASFEKNSNEEVRLTLHEQTIGRCLEIRTWTKARSTDGLPSDPTDRGIVLDVELLPDLRRAIDQAIVEVGGEEVPVVVEPVFRFDFDEDKSRGEIDNREGVI